MLQIPSRSCLSCLWYWDITCTCWRYEFLINFHVFDLISQITTNCSFTLTQRTPCSWGQERCNTSVATRAFGHTLLGCFQVSWLGRIWGIYWFCLFVLGGDSGRIKITRFPEDALKLNKIFLIFRFKDHFERLPTFFHRKLLYIFEWHVWLRISDNRLAKHKDILPVLSNVLFYSLHLTCWP